MSRWMQSDGDDVFIRSLQQYLRANEFSTGSSHKLWETVAQVSGLPIARWMEQWTYHGGFPLVSATLQGSQVTVSQVSQPAVEKKNDRNDSAFWHQVNEKLSVIPGCPGACSMPTW